MKALAENGEQLPTAWASRSLTSDLRRSLAAHPDRVAVRDDDHSMTYQQFWDASARLAGGLARTGVHEGDYVLAMLDNSVDYAVTVVALNFLGAVVVPVNTMQKGSILQHVIRDSRARTAIMEQRYADILLDAADDALETVVVRGEEPLTATSSTSVRRVDFTSASTGDPVTPLERFVWDPMMIGYTSGTTGPSKGVVLSHGYALTVSEPYEVQQIVGDDPVFYVVCPMFHLTGMAGGLFASITAGGNLHIAPRFSASTFAADATAAGATVTTLVGTMVDFLLRQPPQEADARCSLRSAVLIPLHPRVEEFKERFGLVVRTSFGGTESNAILVNTDDTGIERRSCGRVRAGFEVRIVDEHDIEVPDGTVGEAIARSSRPWVSGGAYLGNPEATAAAWRNGWFHTGDLLVRDSDGYFYFVDRRKDAIRRRGENISSIEVEREVLAHSEILECAAVAVDSEHMEQEVKVFAVRSPDSTVSEETLVKFLIDRMPRYSVPRYVEFVDTLPRTTTGKVRKEVLRTQPNDSSWDRVAAGIVVPR